MKLIKRSVKINGHVNIYFLGIKICSYKINREKAIKECNIQRVQRARELGVKIGKDVLLISDPHWGEEPWLIEIGDETCISFKSIFLTHDGSWLACKPYFTEKNKSMGKLGRIKIGKGCFIGVQTTIMPGVTIGNNCVTGACSVVTKDIPNGEVWAGVPAKFICKTSELAKKIEQNYYTPEQQELNKLCMEMKRN